MPALDALHIYQCADRLLEEHWSAVAAAADHLYEHGRAPDRQLAKLAGMANAFSRQV